MGYMIHQISSDFTLPVENVAAALEALKQLGGSETCGAAGQKHFSWINDSSKFLQASSLEEALQVWSWDVTPDDRGGVAELNFMAEKLGDENLLFRALAPFVQNGSSIVMVGEDAKIWRWYFSRGTVHRQAGQISFDDFACDHTEDA